MSHCRALRLGLVLLSLSALKACGLSDPEVARTFYYDPPNELMARDRSATWMKHQFVTRFSASGFDSAEVKPYTGEALYYNNTAWNPENQVIYGYRVNYKPSQTWLMAVAVPSLKQEAVTRIPDHPRGHSYSPLFAFDTQRNQLAVADAQSPCGGQVVNIWNVYDVGTDKWAKNTLDGYAFTTLNYDAREDNFIGVGFQFGEGPVVARIDSSGNVVSQIKADLCAVLEPRQFSYEQSYYQSQIVGGVVHVYRHVYYGKHANDGVFWERQRYLVDIESGATSVVDTKL